MIRRPSSASSTPSAPARQLVHESNGFVGRRLVWAVGAVLSGLGTGVLVAEVSGRRVFPRGTAPLRSNTPTALHDRHVPRVQHRSMRYMRAAQADRDVERELHVKS